MKNIFKLACLVMVIITSFTACQKLGTPYTELTNSKLGAQISISRFNGNTQNLTIFPYQDEARSIEFSASFGALGLPANPINVKFAVDSRALDSLNNLRTRQGLGTYQLFPSDSYTISSLQGTIPAGQINSNLITVSYFSRKFGSTVDYILPISIVAADGYNIGANKTIFLLAPKLAEISAIKTGWTATASSEELVGEGTSSGAVNFLIDGSNTTYWHSKWQAPAPVFPHWFNVDMKTEIFVTKVELIPRQNNNNGFTVFNLEASKDGTTWTSLGTNLSFDPLVKTGQSYSITPAYWRYLKVTTTRAASISTTSTHLAEINVYRY